MSYLENNSAQDDGTDTVVECTITEEVPTFIVEKYLIVSEGIFYTVSNDSLQTVDISEMTADNFNNYGCDSIPSGSLVKTLVNPKIYMWTGQEESKLSMKATVSGTPPSPQEISFVLDTTDKTIKGIDSIEATYTGIVKITFQNGTEWTAEQTMEEFINDTENVWKLCLNNLKMNCKILLYDDATFTDLKFNYNN